MTKCLYINYSTSLNQCLEKDKKLKLFHLKFFKELAQSIRLRRVKWHEWNGNRIFLESLAKCVMIGIGKVLCYAIDVLRELFPCLHAKIPCAHDLEIHNMFSAGHTHSLGKLIQLISFCE